MPAANTLRPTFHQKQVNEGYNDDLNLMVVKIHPNSSAVLLLTTFICPLICVATPFYVIKILQKSTLNRYEHLCEREREWDIENETERECDRERERGVWVCNVLFTVGSLQVSLSRSFSFSYTGVRFLPQLCYHVHEIIFIFYHWFTFSARLCSLGSWPLISLHLPRCPSMQHFLCPEGPTCPSLCLCWLPALWSNLAGRETFGGRAGPGQVWVLKSQRDWSI